MDIKENSEMLNIANKGYEEDRLGIPDDHNLSINLKIKKLDDLFDMYTKKVRSVVNLSKDLYLKQSLIDFFKSTKPYWISTPFIHKVILKNKGMESTLLSVLEDLASQLILVKRIRMKKKEWYYIGNKKKDRYRKDDGRKN